MRTPEPRFLLRILPVAPDGWVYSCDKYGQWWAAPDVRWYGPLERPRPLAWLVAKRLPGGVA